MANCMRRQLTLVCTVLLVAAAAASGQSLLITALTVEDLAYSATTGRLYAVLPAGTGGPESSVAELDPANGAILTRVAIPAGPSGGGATQLAVSADGTVLYVGVNGGAQVRRYALPAFTPGPEFVLGVNSFNQPLTARDLSLVPGSSTTLVVTQGATFTVEELVVYDSGVPRSARVYGRAVAFVTPTLLIETGFGLGYRYRLEATGLVADTPGSERLGGYGFTLLNGVAYDFGGGVTDIASRQVLGTCAAFGYAMPAPDLDLLFYFGGGEVSTCAASTFRRTGRLMVPGLGGGIRAAARTGTGRFALLESSGRLLVADGFTAPLPPPPPPSPGYPWSPVPTPTVRANLTGCTVCRPGDTFSVDGAVRNLWSGLGGEIKAAIVLPNGVAVGATVLGTSHLVLRNLFGDAAATLLRVVLPAGLPPGTWHVEMALLDAATGAVWSRSSVPFEVRP